MRVEETVRINGTARLSVDPELLTSMAVEGNLPRSAIVVEVSEAFLHCAKAFKRAKLWDPTAQVPRASLPSLGTMLADHVKMTPEQKQRFIAELEERMREAARKFEFEKAARVRDQLALLKERAFGASGDNLAVLA